MNQEYIIYVKGFSGGRISIPRISAPRISTPRVVVPRTVTPRVTPRVSEPIHEAPPVAPSRPPVVVNHYHDHYHDGGYNGGGGSNIWFWMYLFDRPQQPPPQVIYQPPQVEYVQQPQESHFLFWGMFVLVLILGFVWWMKK